MRLTLRFKDSTRVEWQKAENCVLALDFGTKTWSIPHVIDPWAKSPFPSGLLLSYSGSFEPRDNGVIWIWETNRGLPVNSLIIREAPTSEGDTRHYSGDVMVYELPSGSSLKFVEFKWERERSFTQTLSASARFDAVVRAHIARALDGAADHASQTERLYYAWQLLKVERGTIPGISADLPFAAAEHNLFARYAVCSGRHSAGEMWLAAKGYEWNKKVNETLDDIQDALGITRSVPTVPPSHSSEDVQRWGEMGAWEGLLDQKR